MDNAKFVHDVVSAWTKITTADRLALSLKPSLPPSILPLSSPSTILPPSSYSCPHLQICWAGGEPLRPAREIHHPPSSILALPSTHVMAGLGKL